jgi:hypothetical protein
VVLKVEDTTHEQIREDLLDLMDEIDRFKREKGATILAHYCVDCDLQDIADYTGDSLKKQLNTVPHLDQLGTASREFFSFEAPRIPVFNLSGLINGMHNERPQYDFKRV